MASHSQSDQQPCVMMRLMDSDRVSRAVFSISKYNTELYNSDDDTTVVDVQVVTESQSAITKSLLEHLGKLKENDYVSEIDISCLSCVNLISLNELTQSLCEVLLKNNVKSLFLPRSVVSIIKGKCHSFFMQMLRHQVGETVNICGNTLKLRDFVSSDIIVKKIRTVDDKVTNLATQMTIDMLEKLHNNISSVTPSLATSIVKGYKTLRKHKRILREENIPRKKRKIMQKESQCNYIGNNISPLQNSSCGIAPDTRETSLENMTRFVDQWPNKCDIRTPLSKQRKCYICKVTFQKSKRDNQEANKQYPRLCSKCAHFNLQKRKETTDLRDRIAVVTGGRIKIGYETVIKLLRDGCKVVTTTRFPRDAAARFAREKDFSDWKGRLSIYPLDMKDIRGVYNFVSYLKKTLPYLDILINNAAQTIRRPVQFYQHLFSYEKLPYNKLPQDQQRLLVRSDACLNYVRLSNEFPNFNPDLVPLENTHPISTQDMLSGDTVSKPDTESHCSNSLENTIPTDAGDYFPVGALDEHGEQVDLRPTNSWNTLLEDVPMVELLEVLMVNTVAPFILTQELKPLLKLSAHSRKFIVNVSAMEGQFSRKSKTEFHPHTNMAKAALNMMTRTAALGYKNDEIYMTCVDTGWITDERPYHQAQHERNNNFLLPLDVTDGAARVCHPIVHGLNDNIEPYYAVFLKNYVPHIW